MKILHEPLLTIETEILYENIKISVDGGIKNFPLGHRPKYLRIPENRLRFAVQVVC